MHRGQNGYALEDDRHGCAVADLGEGLFELVHQLFGALAVQIIVLGEIQDPDITGLEQSALVEVVLDLLVVSALQIVDLGDLTVQTDRAGLVGGFDGVHPQLLDPLLPVGLGFLQGL